MDDFGLWKHAAMIRGFTWVAIDASGEVRAGMMKPERHEDLPLWVWFNHDTVKLGWIFEDVKQWRRYRWEITQ